MDDSDFTREVIHRASLLTGSFNPGRAIRWVSKSDNHQRLLRLQEETRKYLSGDFTTQAVIMFWYQLDASPDIKAFIRCLDAGAKVLCSRGRKGDIYSIPVLHYVVRHFIQFYLRSASVITPEAAG
ncbi:hypothetical protein LU540_004539 [Salmonella enterica]|nr:hypothetical protein [Salmonella enterica]